MRFTGAVGALVAAIATCCLGVPAHAEVRPSAGPGQWLSAQSGLPDSLTGAPAVATETRKEGRYRVTAQSFADGSTAITGVEIGVEATPAELAQMVADSEEFVPDELDGGSTAAPAAAGLDQCTYGSSAGVFYAQNCHVYYHGISWSSSFRANYQQWSGGSAAQYIGGTYNTVTFTGCISDEQIASMESGTRIRYRFNFMPACFASVPFWLDLKVSSTEAYATTGP